jgi:hypothetical protein
VELIRQCLEQRGPLLRREIALILEQAGIPSEGQRVIHLLRRAALLGGLAYGAGTARKETFAALPPLSPPAEFGESQAATLELLRRYLAGFAPAGPADMAAWSGLSRAETRAAWTSLAEELIEVSWPGGRGFLPRARLAWLDDAVVAAPTARLLGRFDPYLLGYDDRDLSVPREHRRRVHPGGGIIHACLLIDGQAAGTWRVKRRAAGLQIELTPFDHLDAAVLDRVEEEVARLGRFYETEAGLRLLPLPGD